MKREWIFWLIVVLLPVGFFVAVEGSLRATGYGPDLSLFVAAPSATGDDPYLRINPLVTQRYFPAGYYVPDTSGDLFLATKPKNGFRVFVLGGSTTAGWPYPANVSFPRLLRRQLAARLPEHHVEVINTAITAVNSHTMLDFIDEILDHEPDLVLIYGGHNEFYGALGAASTISIGDSRTLIRAYLWLRRLRLAALTAEIVNRPGSAADAPEVEALRESPTLMGQVIGDSEIFRGDASFRRAEAQFRANLRDIAVRTRAAGVPLVLSELVSNVRDQAPFISRENGDEPAAAAVFEQARELLADGDADGARELFYEAKDLDLLRFRAPETFNAAIHDVAAEFDIPVVPMLSAFAAASEAGLIGSDVMLEHLHPNTRGLLLMSAMFLASTQPDVWTHDVVSGGENQGIQDLVASLDRAWAESTITELDDAIGRIRIMDLTDHWPFRPEAETGDAVNRYSPVGLAENLAKRIFTQQMSVERAHVRMAEYYASRGEFDLAMREYEAIADIAPLIAENYYNIAEILIDAGVPQLALPFLERSLAIRTDTHALKRIGQIELFAGHDRAAIDALEKAWELNADDTEVSRTLAYAYLLDGRTDEALSVLGPDADSADKALKRVRRFGDRLRPRLTPR